MACVCPLLGTKWVKTWCKDHLLLLPVPGTSWVQQQGTRHFQIEVPLKLLNCPLQSWTLNVHLIPKSRPQIFCVRVQYIPLCRPGLSERGTPRDRKNQMHPCLVPLMGLDLGHLALPTECKAKGSRHGPGLFAQQLCFLHPCWASVLCSFPLLTQGEAGGPLAPLDLIGVGAGQSGLSTVLPGPWQLDLGRQTTGGTGQESALISLPSI